MNGNQNQIGVDVRGVAVDMLVKLEHAYPDSREGSTISNMKACARSFLAMRPNRYRTARLMMKTLFNALGAIFWVACILTLAPVIILAWVLVSLGYGRELEGY